MFRASFIYLSKANWARNLITNWKFAWNAASRFIAGETLEEAIRVVEDLNRKNINATLDHLGEYTNDKDDAKRATECIIQTLEEIARSGVCANMSIKLTQIGLALDKTLCATNLENILRVACETGNFVRIDMEDSSWVENTLSLYCDMREKFGAVNCGVVIQSYLYRSEEDIRKLSSEPARIRLCKGAYKEPPEIAFPKKSEVDANFDKLTTMLIHDSIEQQSPVISMDGKIPPIPAIGSHDPERLKFAKEYARKVGLPKNAIEFQMLHGIRRDLQEQSVAEGYPVRVYVPFGTEWYPYYMRRLAERPANLWFFISNFFRR